MKGRSVEKVVLTLYNAYSYTGMAVNDGDQTEQAQGLPGSPGAVRGWSLAVRGWSLVVRGGPGRSGGGPGWSGAGVADRARALTMVIKHGFSWSLWHSPQAYGSSG